jgi:hypothetical protein
VSDNWLIIVPTDPYAVPAADAVDAARATLAAGLPDAEEIEVERGENPRFVDAGTNFQTVRCPRCGESIDDWWQDTMEKAHRDDFRELAVVTPCCEQSTTLNDLDYDWPQAFARVAIHAMNPNVRELAPDLTRALEQSLGLPIRVIWQHL